ncbi:MAG: efflux RND transporter periplasmic adaptor subunit [Bacteroidetes bacterium]|nr:efflux RND transporter periplasmic adaptor subunit [Bacteroidota bacterium]
MKNITKFLLSLSLLFSSTLVVAHGGEDHGDSKPKVSATPKNYFTTTALSDVYELLIKYEPIKPNEDTHFKLFVSDFESNKPVDNATITITSPENDKLKFEVKQIDNGIYEIHGNFPDKKNYSLTVNINSSLGPDLISITDIEVGKELPVTEADLTAKESFFDKGWVLVSIGFLGALLLMFIFTKLKNKQVNATFLILLVLFGTTPLPTQQLQAHGGEDHGGGSKSGGNNTSNSLEVLKETQFLFNIYTQQIEIGDFTETTKLFGTIIPSSSGQAIVTAPQNGKIVSLSVNVGQQVKQGQQLAVIEQNIDAASQVNLLAEKNNVDAEYEAAKKEYERLKTIQDIASKKELSEAEARYQKASENKKLFNSTGGKTIVLKSPIDGIIGNFTFSIGSTINNNETIFTITNLSKVYVEAQVFDKDAEKVNTGVRYTVECTNDNHKTAEVKLLALAQNINPTNQSQRVLFEMENKDGEFKIGEFVNISVFASQSKKQIAVPNSAISELNGKSIIFIKDFAEQYSLVYVSLGENNGTYTVINKGLEEGERIVTNGAYQLKMMFLNQ